MGVTRRAREFLTRDRTPDFRDFALTLDEAKARSSNPGPLERHFLANQGRLAHKWQHFLPIYDRALAPYRGQAVRFLELGVSYGGSLEMWRAYFGPEAIIHGIDINPECASRFDPPNKVHIGSQADPDLLRRVVSEMGGPPDIVLDDGSHVANHQRASFRVLWPLLAVGGLYVIEDLHTAYWPAFEGGYRRAGSAIEIVKGLIDDMHAPYHGREQAWAPWNELGAIHVHDSVVVIEKADRPKPGHVKTGSPA